MRFLSSFLTLLSASTIGTCALEASVFTFELGTTGEDSKTPIISNDNLRQLLELRTRPSTISTLGKSSEDNIELLSRFGGQSTPLFDHSAEGKLSTVFVIIEGVSDEIESAIRKDFGNGLIVSLFPTISARAAFFGSFLGTVAKSLVGPESKHCAFYADDNDGFDTLQNSRLCFPESITFDEDLLPQISHAESWVDKYTSTALLRVSPKSPVNSRSSMSLSKHLESLFHGFHLLSSDNTRVTTVILPSSKASYRSSEPGITKRDTMLDLARDSGRVAFEQKPNAIHTIAPVCYASNSTCNEATNTCSGHGFCYKKSSSENKADTGDCYACQCYETYIKNDDGTEQKVQWGGPACQKRDISSPFFLIAGVSIAIAVAISTAIGMMYQVGNSDLPGVISAGVGTVRVQK